MGQNEASERLYDLVSVYLSQVWVALGAMQEVQDEVDQDDLVHVAETLLANAENQILEALDAVEDRFGMINIVYETSKAVCVRKIIRACLLEELNGGEKEPANG